MTAAHAGPSDKKAPADMGDMSWQRLIKECKEFIRLLCESLDTCKRLLRVYGLAIFLSLGVGGYHNAMLRFVVFWVISSLIPTGWSVKDETALQKKIDSAILWISVLLEMLLVVVLIVAVLTAIFN